MRSLSLRILLASFGTVVIALAGFVMTSRAMVGPATERLIRHFQARQIEDAQRAFERGGPAEAAAYLDRLNRSLGATHYLTDVAVRLELARTLAATQPEEAARIGRRRRPSREAASRCPRRASSRGGRSRPG